MANKRTVIAIPADQQSGSTVGLQPPTWISSDGIKQLMSEGQALLWEQWEESWKVVKDLRKEKRGTRLIIINNGDAIEGDHNGTTQIITKNLDEQKRIHVASMKAGMKMAGFNHEKGDKLFYVSGTPTHVAYHEDDIARSFLDKKGHPIIKPLIAPTVENDFEDGRYVRDQLYLDVNGVLLDIAHHGFTAGVRAWTKGSTLRSNLVSVYFDYVNKGKRVPRYVIRSHKHEFITERYSDIQGTIDGFITPAFQLKTAYGHMVASLKDSSIGMLIIIVEKDGSTRWECPMVIYDEIQVEKI